MPLRVSATVAMAPMVKPPAKLPAMASAPAGSTPGTETSTPPTCCAEPGVRIRSAAASGLREVIVVASHSAPASIAVACGLSLTVARVPPSARVRTCMAKGTEPPGLSGPASGGTTFSVVP